MLKKKCIYCSKKFLVKEYRRKTAFYCSRECVYANNGMNRGRIKVCLVCKKKFKPETGVAKYCSKECAILVRRKQWRDQGDKKRFGIVRKAILEKHNYKCSSCSASFGTKLHIHHIDGKGRHTNTPNNSLDNLEVLCNSCHQKKEWKRRMKGKWSILFKKCKVCSTVKTPHNARGYCKKCYRKLFR